MPVLDEVEVGALDPMRFEGTLSDERYASFRAAVELAGTVLEGRTIWNVNSTGRGGGVAEMLASLLAYARGAEVDARWMVIGGNADFFKVTKRIHNNLHGAPGDGGPLGDEERRIYEDTLADNARELRGLMRPGDVVILHDPQTAGLTATLKEVTAGVFWRCHVGLDTPNDLARAAWDFLRPYVEPADRYIFSRKAFTWERLADSKLVVIAPSIDAFSPKNQQLDTSTVSAILSATGLVRDGENADPVFSRLDGTQGRVERPTEMYGAPAPGGDEPLVVQVSRWDALKDPLGVIRGFADHIAHRIDARLVVAGPSVAAVADDPEGAQVLADARSLWERLPDAVSQRIHLVCLPMDDLQENAAIVNALQRRAAVVVQKSLAEGFGLTVAEGMWKARPVVASRIGGIQDQIEHGKTGMLIDDPTNLEAYGDAVVSLLHDPGGAEAVGRAAQERVRDEFLGARHLMQYLDLITEVINQ